MVRVGASTILCLLLISCASAPAPSPHLDPARLRQKAALADVAVRDRFLSPEGILVYRRDLSTPPDLKTGPYGDLSDAACWGGYYLGSQALRYAASGSQEALAAVDVALSGSEMLEEVTGRAGLFARTLDRNVEPEMLAKRGGRWRQSGLPGYVYRGQPSRDQYAGLLFGLGCVLRFVDDPPTAARASRLLIDIAHHIEAGDLAIRDIDGELTSHGDLAPRYLGIPVAVNASLVLAAMKLSVAAGGPPEHARRYRNLVEKGYANAASFAKVKVFGKTNRNNDHMATACLFHLEALEEDPEVRELYRRGLARVAVGVRGEGNSLFLGYHMAASGADPELLVEAWSSLALLPVDHTSAVIDLRGKVDGVVPMNLRPASSFTWRDDPYRLTWGADEIRTPREYAPVDYLVAYWLLVAFDLLP